MRISDWSSDVCSSDLRIGESMFMGRLLSGQAGDVRFRDALAEQFIVVGRIARVEKGREFALGHRIALMPGQHRHAAQRLELRSEERRVGKECVSKFRSRWSP